MTAAQRGDAPLRGDAPVPALVLGDLPPLAAERLQALESLARFVPLVDAGARERDAAEILFVWDFRTRTLGDLVRSLPSLRWVHTSSAGLEHVLVSGIVDSDLLVTNAAGVFDEPIAEYVAAVLLAHAKDLARTTADQRARRWAHRELERVAGKRILIVGMGRIGRAVGRLAQRLGMHVAGVRRSGELHPEDPPGATIERDLRAAAAETDYLVVTAALTPETRNLVSAEVIAALPRTAYLANVARAPIVDTRALVDALRSGRIAGAALDVFDQEPLASDSEMWDVPNLAISPHVSGDTIGYTGQLVDAFGENLRRYRRGEALTNLVDLRRGY